MQTAAVRTSHLCAVIAFLSLAVIPPLAAQQAPITLAQKNAALRLSGKPNPYQGQIGRFNFPLSFEANVGQVDSRVKFLSRANGCTLFLTPTGADFVLSEPTAGAQAAPNEPPLPPIFHRLPSTASHSTQAGAKPTPSEPAGNGATAIRKPRESTFKMRLEGANASAMRGEGVLPGKSNYLIGPDPKKWRTDVPTYGKVRCIGVYPGIDLVYYGSCGRLEYDLIVAPKADPTRITLSFDGAQRVTVDRAGDLVVRLKGRTVRWHRPTAYQQVSGHRKSISSCFVLKDRNRAAFAIARYDTRRPLVIDPVFAYASYLGGSGLDNASAIAVDNAGNAYVTGITESKDFPGASMAPPGDAGYLTKIDATGTKILYSTYIGQNVYPNGIAVSGTFEAYVAGRVTDDRLPVVRGAQSATGGGDDGFLMKINAAGNGLEYSTYLGGSDNDNLFAVALGPDGSAYVTGFSWSGDFPTVAPYQAASHGQPDAIVARIDTTKSGRASLLYSTYLGGSDQDLAWAITVDPRGQFYEAGRTASPDFPIVAAFEPVLKGTEAAFVSVLSADGTRLLYSTYLGDKAGTTFAEFEVDARGIAVDGSQHAFVCGNGFAGSSPGAPFSGFVAEIDCAAAGSASLVYMQSPGFNATGIGIDVWGNACISGYVGATAFAAKYHNGDGSLMFQSSFGPGGAGAIAVDRSGYAYITGNATGPGFPVTADAFQTHTTDTQSPTDGFVVRMPTYTKLDFNGDATPDLMFQNRFDGRLIYWLMSREQQTKVDFLDTPNPGTNWQVVGSADLNGDGETDLIFQDSNTGDLSYWLMYRTQQMSTGVFSLKNPGPAWQVVGVSDLDRDGYADLIFQNTVSGDLYAWFLQGTTVIGGNFLSPRNPGAGWKVAAVGDLNNDGQPDLIFQNTNTGSLYIWYLRYGTLLSGGFTNPPNPGPGWSVAGLSDINGDGKLEILFQNSGTGQVAYWAMKGLNVARFGFPNPSNPGTPWRLVGSK